MVVFLLVNHLNAISIVYFRQIRLFTEKFWRESAIHPDIFRGLALWANSVSPRTNPIASRDQFKPIRIGENSVVNYKEWYKLVMQCFLCYTMEFTTCHLYFLGYTLALRCDSFVYINSFKLWNTLVAFCGFDGRCCCLFFQESRSDRYSRGWPQNSRV